MTLSFYHKLSMSARLGVRSGMALTPEQASQLTSGDFEKVQELERDLDAKLLVSFNAGNPKFDYDFNQTKDGTKQKLKVILGLQRRYEVAGWVTTLTREGDSVFSMRLETATLAGPSMTVHKRLMSAED